MVLSRLPGKGEDWYLYTKRGEFASAPAPTPVPATAPVTALAPATAPAPASALVYGPSPAPAFVLDGEWYS